MTSIEIWLTILGLTGVTLVTRNFFLVLGDRLPLPERVQHGLRYAPGCALAALIAPELLVQHGAVALTLANAKFVAGLAAIATMLATRNMIATMAIGMTAFAATRHFVA
jgi:branched-subunit amino acid transport protein